MRNSRIWYNLYLEPLEDIELAAAGLGEGRRLEEARPADGLGGLAAAGLGHSARHELARRVEVEGAHVAVASARRREAQSIVLGARSQEGPRGALGYDRVDHPRARPLPLRSCCCCCWLLDDDDELRCCRCFLLLLLLLRLVVRLEAVVLEEGRQPDGAGQDGRVVEAYYGHVIDRSGAVAAVQGDGLAAGSVVRRVGVRDDDRHDVGLRLGDYDLLLLQGLRQEERVGVLHGRVD